MGVRVDRLGTHVIANESHELNSPSFSQGVSQLTLFHENNENPSIYSENYLNPPAFACQSKQESDILSAWSLSVQPNLYFLFIAELPFIKELCASRFSRAKHIAERRDEGNGRFLELIASIYQIFFR